MVLETIIMCVSFIKFVICSVSSIFTIVRSQLSQLQILNAHNLPFCDRATPKQRSRSHNLNIFYVVLQCKENESMLFHMSFYSYIVMSETKD